jgi:hypothetical protein
LGQIRLKSPLLLTLGKAIPEMASVQFGQTRAASRQHDLIWGTLSSYLSLPDRLPDSFFAIGMILLLMLPFVKAPLPA